MEDFKLEKLLTESYCNVERRLKVSEGCKKRLNHLTVGSKHTKVRNRILLSQIICLFILLILVPATAYATSTISNALIEKVKDANLSQKQIESINEEILESDFSEQDIENFSSLYRNEYGQTYGIDVLGADLIKAVSEEGLEGYVYRDDLYCKPDFKTPEEALEWQENRPEYRIISVYKSDGKTVIGTFKIQNGNSYIDK